MLPSEFACVCRIFACVKRDRHLFFFESLRTFHDGLNFASRMRNSEKVVEIVLRKYLVLIEGQQHISLLQSRFVCWSVLVDSREVQAVWTVLELSKAVPRNFLRSRCT